MQGNGISRNPAEARIRGQLRKAMNAYIAAPSPALWDRVLRLDAQLRALTAGAAR